MIQVTDVTKWFGTESNKTYALKNVSLTVQYGEMLYIVGPSGSGKTTLLSIISGILRPTNGIVKIKNQEIWQLDDNAMADFRLYTVGFVFQDFHLFPKLTSLENVAIPLILQKKPWDECIVQAHHYLKIVGLENRENLTPHSLSIGEQQRVAIARAIITEPDLLIFDEPTASLDGTTGKKIISFIKENILNKKRTIIVVTHDDRIYEFATRALRLDDGRIVGEMEKIHEN
jgi:putative ABC transport system ATP-binding protein